jgi:polyferredoxin
MTEEEEDNLDLHKFDLDRFKYRADRERFNIKERNDNLRAALSQAHEDHRQALGMIFKTAVANTTVFAGLAAFYLALPTNSPVKFGVSLLGLVACILGVFAQRIAVLAFRINAENYLLPVRKELGLRRSHGGKPKRRRERLEKYTKRLLLVIYVVYLLAWIWLIFYGQPKAMETIFVNLKGSHYG